VLLSSGAVAFTIISLLPVELILQVGSKAGFAMVFALLIAAIVWNLSTWYLGLPSSSSHTLIGSIIGVGLMNQVMVSGTGGTAGVDWSQAANIGKSLFVSPLVGFFGAALLLLCCRALLRVPRLYEAPKGNQPPPWWIRSVLVLTCTGVSFAHGSNDGQKGMGLIMLILIGTVPTAFALNRSVGADAVAVFASDSACVTQVLASHGGAPFTGDARTILLETIERRAPMGSSVPALSELIASTAAGIAGYGSLAAVPTANSANVRNDLYLISETLGLLKKKGSLGLSAPEQADLDRYKGDIDDATKFIPT
jgi:inorganic phosphate transporter, PiT family